MAPLFSLVALCYLNAKSKRKMISRRKIDRMIER